MEHTNQRFTFDAPRKLTKVNALLILSRIFSVSLLTVPNAGRNCVRTRKFPTARVDVWLTGGEIIANSVRKSE